MINFTHWVFGFITGVLVTITYTVITAARPPEPAVAQVYRVSQPKCAHLYNVGKHKEWADCMGVGYETT